MGDPQRLRELPSSADAVTEEWLLALGEAHAAPDKRAYAVAR